MSILMIINNITCIILQIMRWTTKTNNLLEQYKNINPEEYKRMLDEKKLFQQQIASLKTENQKTKVQLETVKNNLASTSEEISALQVKIFSLTFTICLSPVSSKKLIMKCVLLEPFAVLFTAVSEKVEY